MTIYIYFNLILWLQLMADVWHLIIDLEKVWKSQKFFSYDLDLDPMTLILKLNLDMVQMYLHAKNEVSMSRGSKVIAWTDRNTDRQEHRHTDMTGNIICPHMRVVKMTF